MGIIKTDETGVMRMLFEFRINQYGSIILNFQIYFPARPIESEGQQSVCDCYLSSGHHSLLVSIPFTLSVHSESNHKGTNSYLSFVTESVFLKI